MSPKKEPYKKKALFLLGLCIHMPSLFQESLFHDLKPQYVQKKKNLKNCYVRAGDWRGEECPENQRKLTEFEMRKLREFDTYGYIPHMDTYTYGYIHTFANGKIY